MTETKDWCHLPGYSLGQKWVQTLPMRQRRTGEPDPGQQKLALGESGVCMAQLGRPPCGETKIWSCNAQLGWSHIACKRQRSLLPLPWCYRCCKCTGWWPHCFHWWLLLSLYYLGASHSQPRSYVWKTWQLHVNCWPEHWLLWPLWFPWSLFLPSQSVSRTGRRAQSVSGWLAAWGPRRQSPAPRDPPRTWRRSGWTPWGWRSWSLSLSQSALDKRHQWCWSWLHSKKISDNILPKYSNSWFLGINEVVQVFISLDTMTYLLSKSLDNISFLANDASNFLKLQHFTVFLTESS